MDWIDKISITVIAVLSVVTLGMLTGNEIEKQKNALESPVTVTVEDKAPAANDSKLFEEIESLQAKGLYADAMTKLEDIVKLHPNNSEAYVHMAKVSIGVGDVNRALQSYKTAVEMEPDYVDKKATRFIGRAIKSLVTESQPKLLKYTEENPEDKEAKKALKNTYYLQRRLAGGCE